MIFFFSLLSVTMVESLKILRKHANLHKNYIFLFLPHPPPPSLFSLPSFPTHPPKKKNQRCHVTSFTIKKYLLLKACPLIFPSLHDIKLLSISNTFCRGDTAERCPWAAWIWKQKMFLSIIWTAMAWAWKNRGFHRFNITHILGFMKEKCPW